MNGFFNIFKPRGKTSHDVVGIARRILHEKKIGHSGTLDPDTDGVLPIAVGKSTRLIDFLPSNKSYRFEMIFGFETDTGDSTGKILRECEGFELPSREFIIETLNKFIGEIDQVPPKFSAIKINGRKAYDLARKNLEFEIPSRRVKIDRLELLRIDQKSIECEVDCWKGTYIRSLCIDLGREFGIPATMNRLTRIRSGNFSIEDSIHLEDLSLEKVIAPEKCLEHIPRIDLPEDRGRAFLNGLSTRLNHHYNVGNYRVFCDGSFIGIGIIKDSEIFPYVVLK